MKFSDVRKLMERNRALTEFSSLPFVITKDGEKTVTWFNFSLGKSEDQLCVKVREILDTKDGVELNKEASQIAVPADKAKNSVPEITEKEYYQELEKIYEKYSRKEMEALIQKAANGLFVETYHEVILHEADEEKETETEAPKMTFDFITGSEAEDKK